MVKFYAMQVRMGRMEISQIPERYREQVIAYLENER